MDEIILDDSGNKMYVCSDSCYCRERREKGHVGPMAFNNNVQSLVDETS